MEIIGRGVSQTMDWNPQLHSTLRDLLRTAGIELEEGEWVFADGVPLAPDTILLEPPYRLEIRKAASLTVIMDGQQQNYTAPGPTVGEALWQAGIRLRIADRVEPALYTPLESIPGSPILIRVERARDITVQVDGKTIYTIAAGETTGEALAQAGLASNGLDYSIPAETEPVPADGQIRIIRVREEYLREQSPIPFETETQPAADLELDQTKWIQAGIPGIMETAVRVRFEDNVEFSRTSEGQHILVPPQTRILGYGTQLVIRTAETDDGPIQYYRAVSVYATSYYCGLMGDPPHCNFITYSGKKLAKGMIAMTLRWYNMFAGQSVYVQGYGFATVEDVGTGPNAPFWIDVSYLVEEYQGWHKYTMLYFLAPAPPNVPWILD